MRPMYFLVSKLPHSFCKQQSHFFIRTDERNACIDRDQMLCQSCGIPAVELLVVPESCLFPLLRVVQVLWVVSEPVEYVGWPDFEL